MTPGRISLSCLLSFRHNDSSRVRENEAVFVFDTITASGDKS